MFGINEARRRKLLAEEQATPSYSSFGGTNKIKRETYLGFIHPRILRERKKEVRRAEETYLHSLGTPDEMQAKKELKVAQNTRKETANIIKERNKPIERGIGFLFSSKREFGQKPKKLSTKAVRGIYHSPFKR